MATIQDFEERIEKQKAELAKLEAKKKELEKKIRERNRKWRSLVTHSACLLYTSDAADEL